MSLNKVMLIGNLGADPELKHLPSGQAVCELRVATNERWTDKQGQKQERTEWHRVVVWGKTAENCSQYLSKGRQVYVEGRLQTRTWDDKEGNKRYITEVVANNVMFLGAKDGASHRPPPPTEENPPESSGEVDAAPVNDDDIPF